MWNWLKSLYAKSVLAKTQRQLHRRLVGSGAYQEMKACGGKVTLHSYQPAESRVGTVTRIKVDGSEETTRSGALSTFTWEGRAYFSCWDGTLDLEFTTAGTHPSEAELSHLEKLLADSPFIKPEVEEHVFRYYLERVVPHGPTEEDGTPLPVISTPDELGRVVYLPPSISFNLDDLDLCDLTFDFGCKWNYYSVEVYVKDWQVVRVQ